jgi:signal transduction histidine kinase
VAEQHVQRWLVRAVGLLWIAQLGPWAVAAWGQDFASTAGAWVIVGTYLAYCGWGLVLFGVVLRRRSPGVRLRAAMVVVMAACVLVVGLAAKPGTVVGWQNWTPAPATGVGMLAQALGGWQWGVGSVVLLGGTWAATALRDLAVAPQNLTALVGNLGQLAAFTAVGGMVFTRLLSAARTADTALAAALAAEGAQARMQERMRQYEMLHTNVLTTLTLISRGDGAITDEMRRRCGREVGRLRTLVRSVVEGQPPGLTAALAEVVLAQEGLGLRIHHEVDALPADLPSEVVDAVAGAVTEALNNVVKHAGVDEARVVATGDDGGGLRITVTDQGCGFAPAAVAVGVGLGRTLGAAVHEVGGVVTLRSWPGEGTSVELEWAR